MKLSFDNLRTRVGLWILPKEQHYVPYPYRPHPPFEMVVTHCTKCGRTIHVPKLRGVELTKEDQDMIDNIVCSGVCLNEVNST